MRILLNVDRGVNIVADKAFVKQDRVLVVVTFPGHKADEGVLTQRDLSLRGSGTVREDLSLFNALADTY